MASSTKSEGEGCNHQLKLLPSSGSDYAVDRITRLPDDILISILSRLPLREATYTSTLSTRWRHLYTHIDRLKFPPFKFTHGQEHLLERKEEFSNYVNKINHALGLHSGNVVLKEFTVVMECMEGADLERWLEFALSRQVEIIDITMRYFGDPSLCYTLKLSNLISPNNGGDRSLKRLWLSGIDVHDLEVELLLSSFPLLESLYISDCKVLKNISVVGRGHQVLKLKKLCISCVHNLQSIEIRDAVNLVHLMCAFGRLPFSLRLSNVPKLTELWVLELCGDNLAKMLRWIPSSICDQLRLIRIGVWPTIKMIQPDYELKNVKHLELIVYMHLRSYPNRHLEKLFPLIEACTSLETLEVKFLWSKKKENETTTADVLVPPKQFSQNLKKIVLWGYLGSKEEFEFASLKLKNVAALEELHFKPGKVEVETGAKMEKIVVAGAWRQLRPIIPKSVN